MESEKKKKLREAQRLFEEKSSDIYIYIYTFGIQWAALKNEERL